MKIAIIGMTEIRMPKMSANQPLLPCPNMLLNIPPNIMPPAIIPALRSQLLPPD